MLLRIIILSVLFQALQHEGSPRDEQAVGADDDKDDRRKEKKDSLQRAFDDQRNAVTRPQRQHADDQQQPSGFRLPFPRALCAEQLHRLHAADRNTVDHIRQSVQRKERCRRDQQGDGIEIIEARHDLRTKQPADQQRGQLIEQRSKAQPQCHGRERCDQRLGEQYPGDMALFHSQYVVKPVLALAALHQKAVDIEDQNEGQQPQHRGAHPHEGGKVRAAQRLRQSAVHRQRDQNIKAA